MYHTRVTKVQPGQAVSQGVALCVDASCRCQGNDVQAGVSLSNVGRTRMRNCLSLTHR